MHDRLGERVHGPVGLVQQEHLRIVDQRAHDLGAPRHARGDLARKLFRHVGEPGFGQHVRRLFQGFRLAHGLLDDRTVGDVLEQRLPGKEGAVLEYDHPVGALVGQGFFRAAQQLTVQVDLPEGDGMEPGDGVQQSGLSTARRADDHAHLAGRDLQRTVVHRQNVDPFRVVDLGHVADADGAPGRLRRRRRRRRLRRDPGARRFGRGLGHHRPSRARARIRHCIIRLPTALTIAEVPQPTKPRVIMAMTMETYVLIMYESMIM